MLLCYVDHHDKAYDWAERRKLNPPRTGAAQLVVIRETVQEIVRPVYVQAELVLPPKAAPVLMPLFANTADDKLLGYGVPTEWLADVKQATEDTLLVLIEDLPAEAAEALLELKKKKKRFLIKSLKISFLFLLKGITLLFLNNDLLYLS